MTAKKTIYIIRHGQTDYNKNGIIQGRGIDSSLNDIGLNQAAKFYRAYHHVPFDSVYTSTLKRTHQSVNKFLAKGCSHTILPALDEINWGDFEGLKGNAETQKIYQGIVEDWSAGLLDRCIENGETPNQVFRRQTEGLKKILSKDEKNILICMHGRAMRIFLCLLTNTPLHKMDQSRHSNLTLYVLVYDGEKFKLIKENCTKHPWK